MQQHLLEARPTAALGVFVVWIPVLVSDSLEEARKGATLITDVRANHFYDNTRRVGGTIAASLGGAIDVPAWDTYLFYRAGPAWDTAPPLPDRWMHQLGPSTWADPDRFRWAHSLVAEFQAAAAELL